ncbi:Hypothetical protein A7982_04434 [Minicystis rosea]|nr:Hypothetical protein A7982_04434 [Minicystis rosea]
MGALALAGVVAAGCSSTQQGSSVVRGQIQQGSFPDAVTAISVVSDKGASFDVAVAADGKFSLPLPSGSSYRFMLSAGSTVTPLVLRSNKDHLETVVVVKSIGASVDIGAVRFRPAVTARSKIAPITPGASGKAVQACSAGDGDGETDDDGGADCVDGIDAQTKQICDGGPLANPTGDGASDGETNDDADAETADDANDADAETADDANDADPAQAMGVPDLELPGSIGCADGDGEEQDDDTEQNDD